MNTPFYTELVEKLTNPMKQKPYKASSVKPVYSYLKNLNGGVPPTSVDFLLNRPIILPFLEKYEVGTQRSIVFAIRNIAKDYERQDILRIWKQNIDDAEAGKGLPAKNEKSEAQEIAYAKVESDKGGDAWDNIVKIVEEKSKEMEEKKERIQNTGEIKPSIEFKGKIYPHDEGNIYSDKDFGVRTLEYVIPNLYTMFPPRRNLDYTEMKIVNGFDPTLSKEYNYLVIQYRKKKPTAEQLKTKRRTMTLEFKFVFNRYKTDGVYHQQIFDVPNDLTRVLQRWIDATKKEGGDFLLTKIGRYTHEKQKGEKLVSDDITDILHRTIGSGIGTQMLRHMYLDKYNNPEREQIIKEMMGDAEKMAHSISTQQQTYVKK